MDETPDFLELNKLRESIEGLVEQIVRARNLLREWRDKYGGREHYGFSQFTGQAPQTASPTDLLRDTTRFLEGR